MKRVLLASAVALFAFVNLGVSTPAVQASSYGYAYRGSYTRLIVTRTYSYRTYNYYSVTHQAYRSHVAVYFAARPNFVYYYNPHTNRYWGRYDIAAKGYSLLAESDCKGSLSEISECAFPKPGALPPVEKGGETLLPPPEAVQ